jgi:ubiquinone/menaquinone biosynthesis C-methylase UbiE
MRADNEPGQYVLGHSEQELARLERQADLFRAETTDTLRRAGLTQGMHVLDVGCGTGDVAMVAAELVGPSGSVLGIDTAEEALAAARARAARLERDWLRFERSDIHGFEAKGDFDAVTGRFILLHLADPAGALKHLAGCLRPGGIAAFIEMDIEQAAASPELPLLTQCIDWITSTYRRVGVEPNMGSLLYATFRKAGLTPQLAGHCRIESGPHAFAFAYAAQTLQSLLPKITELGIATAAEIDVDTLADRLRVEAVAGDHCLFLPRLIGAWARTNG